MSLKLVGEQGPELYLVDTDRDIPDAEEFIATARAAEEADSMSNFKPGDRIIGLAAFPDRNSELVEGIYHRSDAAGDIVKTDRGYIRTIIPRTAKLVEDEPARDPDDAEYIAYTDRDETKLTAEARQYQWTTKSTGERAAFANGGVRDTEAGKPRFDLLRPVNVPHNEQMLTRFAALMARGAEKYAARNWEQFSDVESLSRARSSAARHFEQWLNRETDEDHAAAVYFNVMAYEYITGILEGHWLPLTEGD